jgi:hypothetical protein
VTLTATVTALGGRGDERRRRLLRRQHAGELCVARRQRPGHGGCVGGAWAPTR